MKWLWIDVMNSPAASDRRRRYVDTTVCSLLGVGAEREISRLQGVEVGGRPQSCKA